MDEKKSKDLIWLNQPIDNDEDDIIGVSTIVDKLESAVDNGAQMIALTSSFGSGKSSIIELFEKRRKKKKNERTIKLSMWSQLRSLTNDNGDLSFDHTLELHKSFVYQLVSTINTKEDAMLEGA